MPNSTRWSSCGCRATAIRTRKLYHHVRPAAQAERGAYSFDLSSLVRCAPRTLPAGGEAADDRLVGPIVREYYGGSETGPVVACPARSGWPHPARSARGVQLAIKIYSGDAPSAGRTFGEVYIGLGPNCRTSPTSATTEALAMERDGFLSLATRWLDETASSYLSDRINDMVISAG